MNKKDLPKFEEWLRKHGCEIMPATNQYELLRFKGKEVGVLYTTGKTNNKYAADAILAYFKNYKWAGGAVSTVRKGSYYKQKLQLLERDGTRCFYCGKEMEEDITVEHLIALNSGGQNLLSNMVLAHAKCNMDVGHKPVSEKVFIAINNRLKP